MKTLFFLMISYVGEKCKDSTCETLLCSTICTVLGFRGEFLEFHELSGNHRMVKVRKDL